MKLIYQISSIMPILFSVNMNAQVYQTSQNKAAPKPTMTNASDSLKMAVNDAKNSFNILFKGHKKDTTDIIISDIDYEDSNLIVLKENLKKLKGVKFVSEQYKSNNVILKVPFKGQSTDLWDGLPSNIKAPFKLIEADNNSITLKFKNDKTQK